MTPTLVLENSLKEVCQGNDAIKDEVNDLYTLYWSGGVSTAIGLIASASDPATKASALSKQNIIDSLTMVEALKNFFGNSAVGTGAYDQTCTKLLYGSTASGSVLSVPLEAYGDRVKSLAGTLMTLFAEAKRGLKTYNLFNIDVAIGTNASVPASRVVYGAEMTKELMLVGVVFTEQFKKLMNGEAVSTGDYAGSVALWAGM